MLSADNDPSLELQPARVQDLFSKFQAVLGLYVTNRCNASCSHCATDSSPRAPGPFSEEVLDLALESLEEAPWVKAIHVSGGEPFIVPDALRRVGERAAARKILFAVNTNGFWARTETRARALLSRTTGLTQILVSTSKYHQEYVPVTSVANAVRAGLDLGLAVDVSVCEPPGERDDLAVVTEALGETLLRQIRLVHSPLEAAGRASGLVEARWRRRTERLPRGRCVRLNRPVVLPDGTITACCNTPAVQRQSADSPLVLGKLGSTSLNEAYADADSSSVVQTIRCFGPRRLAEQLVAVGCRDLLKGNYLDSDICDLCSDIVTQPAAVQRLSRLFSTGTHERDVAIARAALFGETGPLRELSPGASTAKNADIGVGGTEAAD